MEAATNITSRENLLKTLTHNSQRVSKVEKQALLQRLASNASKGTSTPFLNKKLFSPSAKIVAQVSKSAPPLTAAEKRQAMMRPTSSVSTASRPALIKTGSMSSCGDNKPKWL